MAREILMAVVAVAQTLVVAQADPLLHSRFEAAMKRAAPDWLHQPGAPPAPRSYKFSQWKRGVQRVALRYDVYASVSEAHQVLHDEVRSLPVPTRPISGLGDEAYLVAPVDPLDERVVRFRRDTMIFEVRAPGEDGVRHFAALFLAEYDEHISGRHGPR
jgi:hypothetical protein